MAGTHKRTKRIGGSSQPNAACRMARYTEPRMLPGDVMAEALSTLSPEERKLALRRFDHMVRAHPVPRLDDEEAALVAVLDTPALRVDLARDALAERGTEDMPPWRVAEAVLDLNQDRSGIAQDVLVERLSSLRSRGVRVARWRESDLLDGPEAPRARGDWASGG